MIRNKYTPHRWELLAWSAAEQTGYGWSKFPWIGDNLPRNMNYYLTTTISTPWGVLGVAFIPNKGKTKAFNRRVEYAQKKGISILIFKNTDTEQDMLSRMLAEIRRMEHERTTT